MEGLDSAPSASPARDALISEGAALFARDGIEGVSLREVTRAAGQRNVTALQYHFGDRSGLVRAIVARGAERVGRRRLALLDLADADALNARTVAALYVEPLLPELRTDAFGRAFLEVVGQLTNRTNHDVVVGDALWPLIHDDIGSMTRWSDIVEPMMPRGAAGRPLHRRFAAVRLVHLELARRARFTSSGAGPLFAANLVDLMEAVMFTSPSQETVGLLRDGLGRTRGDV